MEPAPPIGLRIGESSLECLVMKIARLVSLGVVGLGLCSCAGHALGQAGGAGVIGFNEVDPGSRYGAAFFPGTRYDPNVTPPEAILGFTLGERPATHAQIEECLQTWTAESDRLTLVEYAEMDGSTPVRVVDEALARCERLWLELTPAEQEAFDGGRELSA